MPTLSLLHSIGRMFRQVQDIVEYALFLFLLILVSKLSLRGATAVGRFLGDAVYRFTPIRKEVTMANLRHAFPEKPEEELRHLARGAYRNYGISVTIMLWYGKQTKECLRATVEYVHPEVYTRAIGEGKGVIVLSAHFGNWELFPPTLHLHFGQPILMIVQRQRNRYIDRRVDSIRKRFGDATVPMGTSIREVLSSLRRGESIIILGDQSGPKEAEFVPFFGRLAATHRGAAAFSRKTGAPIVLVMFIRQPDVTTRAVFELVDQSGIEGSGEAAIAELTRRHAAVLEKYIRAYPDQWLWMHKRWKHTPPPLQSVKPADHAPHVSGAT